MSKYQTETAKFVEMMDKFFDCFNVSNLLSGVKKRNPFLDPWIINDFRVEVKFSEGTAL